MNDQPPPAPPENDRCNCGAALAPGAQYCHNCGRPVTEEAAAEERKRLRMELEAGRAGREQEQEEEGAPKRQAGPPRVGFGNRDAVRASYWGAALAALLGAIPLVNLLCFVWYPAAGFISVYAYRRRTGVRAKPGAGAMLGFITGVLAFAISAAINAIGAVAPGVDFTEALRSQVEQAPGQAETKQQLLEMLENPAAVAMILLISMALWFGVTVAFTTLGGALGAKVMEED